MVTEEKEHTCIFKEYGECKGQLVKLRLGKKKREICNAHAWEIFEALGEEGYM